jgi:excisionase family DNA binding protein
MQQLAEHRLDASKLTKEDRASLDKLSEVLSDEHPALIGREGVKIKLPTPVFHLLVSVVRDMRAGKSIVLLPLKEPFTTQAAANFLGVSRPFLIQLLETGKIPHHKVGTHRRVQLEDLLRYMSERDKKRRELLDQLSDEVEALGLYESSPKKDAAG